MKALVGRGRIQRLMLPSSPRCFSGLLHAPLLPGWTTGRRLGWLSMVPPAVRSVAPCRTATNASGFSCALAASCTSSWAGSSRASSVRLQGWAGQREKERAHGCV